MTSVQQEMFDALYPFSFMTDSEGTITIIGRSLQKIHPSLRPSIHFLEGFALQQPELKECDVSPAQLVGEMVALSCSSGSRANLRGQVVKYASDPCAFIFSLEFTITSLSDISRVGLTLSDFKVGDPVFDFLLYMQGQQIDQTKLRTAKSNLEWKNKIFQLLLEISLEIEKSETEREVYQKVLTSVCTTFHWDFGHVFVTSEEHPNLLVSGDVWEIQDPDRFSELHQATQGLRLSFNEGLPGRVMSERKVVWVPSLLDAPFFPRRKSLHKLQQLSGVGVPVLIGDEVTAVLEFFTDRKIDEINKLFVFFDLLSLQVSSVIARQRAEIQARHHAATLAQASKMATLGEISAGIAHEINNPLHTLTLTTTLLKRLSSSDRLSKEILMEQLSRFETCIDRMAMIVSELKAFSRDSSNDIFQSTSLKGLIAETLDLCHSRLLGKDVSIFMQEIPEEWAAECRASQISQVILNLLNNAYDAVSELPDRWIKIELFERSSSFEIVITDSGSGIAPGTAEKIMSPFFTTKPPGKGTGLGLSISSNIMTDHGGSLVLDRTSPHTRFVLTLPRKQDQQKLSQLETTVTSTAEHRASDAVVHHSENSQRPNTDCPI